MQSKQLLLARRILFWLIFLITVLLFCVYSAAITYFAMSGSTGSAQTTFGVFTILGLLPAGAFAVVKRSPELAVVPIIGLVVYFVSMNYFAVTKIERKYFAFLTKFSVGFLFVCVCLWLALVFDIW